MTGGQIHPEKLGKFPERCSRFIQCFPETGRADTALHAGPQPGQMSGPAGAFRSQKSRNEGIMQASTGDHFWQMVSISTSPPAGSALT